MKLEGSSVRVVALDLAPPVDEMNQLLMGPANAFRFTCSPSASRTCRRPETSVDCLGCSGPDSGWCASFRNAIEGRLLGLGRSIPARAAGREQLRASARGHSSPRPTSYSGRRCADLIALRRLHQRSTDAD